MTDGAKLSDCGTYRYTLWRDASPIGSGNVLFIGVNPSTADAETDDATVRKWRGFSSRWGFKQFKVGNLFAFRSTDVRNLATAEDPVGPENDDRLRSLMIDADLVVPCWGNVEKVPGWKAKQLMRDRVGVIREMLQSVACPVRVFGLTGNGDPKHPLMLGYSTPLQDWTP